MIKPGIAIHGGAGTILRSSLTAEKEKEYTEALRAALYAGYQILEKGFENDILSFLNESSKSLRSIFFINITTKYIRSFKKYYEKTNIFIIKKLRTIIR